MPHERLIRRYSPYFEGWAQALGNHRGGMDDDLARNWLYGEDYDQLGLILTAQVTSGPLGAIGGQVTDCCTLTLGPDQMGVVPNLVPMDERDQEAISHLRWLLAAPGELFLFQTYHLVYPQGTRILTLSRRPPLAIMYREVESLLVRFT